MTNACTGRCKHCSEGERASSSSIYHIDGYKGAEIVRQICNAYKIESLMTFGGEPLLYSEDVFKIQSAAKESGIEKRHVITNGFFSKDERIINDVAKGLAESGVSKIMLSVDAFHQETIPLEYVKLFAEAVLKYDVFIVTHPAWLVSADDANPYNIKTKEILSDFACMGIYSSKGNIIFPKGNAKKYLRNYFDKNSTYVNPYKEDPKDIKTISVSADGSVLNNNINNKNIIDIMNDYNAK